MKRLWIADIHANLPALEAVIKDAGGADETVFLGDIVGFGPHPAECVDFLMRMAPKAVIGNHDKAILRKQNMAVFGPGWRVSWDDWTFLQLSPGHLSYLGRLPDEMEMRACGAAARVRHMLPCSPYLHPDMPDEVLLGIIQNFPGRLIVLGHSHHPIDRSVAGKRVVCVPSAGQPRNGKPQAGYAVEENGQLIFKFTDYNLEKTASDVSGIGLSAAFTERWVSFLKTGYDSEWSREWK